MSDSRNDELRPGYVYTQPSVAKGIRRYTTSSLLKKGRTSRGHVLCSNTKTCTKPSLRSRQD